MIILNFFVVFVFLIVFGAKADWQFKSKKYLLTIVFGALLGVAFRFFNFESGRAASSSPLIADHRTVLQ